MVVLPVIRLNRFRDTLRDLGFSSHDMYEIMTALENHVEDGARRIGSLCTHEGCKYILDVHTSEPHKHQSYHCPEHGRIYDKIGLPCVVVFEPIVDPIIKERQNDQ